MSKLVAAIRIAAEAHGFNRRDKGGAMFIGHPLRVMARMETEEEMIVAVLHDVFEQQINEGGGPTPWGYVATGLLTDAEAEALDALTRIRHEPYPSYIARLRPNVIARRVKLADLEDNTHWTRGESLGTLGDRYKEAKEMLEWDLGLVSGPDNTASTQLSKPD